MTVEWKKVRVKERGKEEKKGREIEWQGEVTSGCNSILLKYSNKLQNKFTEVHIIYKYCEKDFSGSGKLYSDIGIGSRDMKLVKIRT